jgi:hypothetical protein
VAVAPHWPRYTIVLGMLGFALGALLTGAAVGLVSLAVGRCLDGFGKMMVTALFRTTIYKEFDRLLLMGIGRRGVSVGPTVPESHDADAWSNGCSVAVASGQGLPRTARRRLHLRRQAFRGHVSIASGAISVKPSQ